jgi:two-component system, LytTR family, response regulator
MTNLASQRLCGKKFKYMESRLLKAIIVDDEKPSREALSNYINEYCPGVEIVAECKSAKAAYKSIMEYQPQLVFLDIEMPRGNGFDLLKMFKTIPFKVIFVTAFSEYAIQAFRFSATDYLMKPVKVGELIEAVDKVKLELNTMDSFQNIITLLENFDSPAGETKKLVIPDLKGFSVIRISEIVYCEADGYCTTFHLAGNSKISSSKNLKYYEELLPAKQFMRVHHSYIINIQHVIGYTHQGEILLSGNQSCPLSAAFKPSFLKHFRKFK